MFDIPSIRIGRAFGIPVEINLSWLVVFALVAFSLATSYFPSIDQAKGAPSWLLASVGVLTTLAFFVSVLAHELCHSLVARAQGGHVEKITLFIFGGVAQIDEEPRTPGREFLMAAAGPAMSMVIAAGCFGTAMVSSSRGLPWWTWAPLEYLGTINFAVGAFNLLPGFPLDGGRVLRSVLWAITKDILKATRWASRSGQFIGWTMVAVAVMGVVNGRIDMIWFGLVGWFIASLAGQAYHSQEFRSKLEGVAVSRIMSSLPEYVDGEMSLDQLVQRYFLEGRHNRYPVMYGGSIIGLISLSDIRAVAQPDWPYVKTADVANRKLDELVIPAEAEVAAAISRLAGNRPGALLVVREGRLVGIVTRTDVLALVEGPSAS